MLAHCYAFLIALKDRQMYSFITDKKDTMIKILDSLYLFVKKKIRDARGQKAVNLFNCSNRLRYS